MISVLGVDGFKNAWVVVRLTGGAVAGVTVHRAMTEVVGETADAIGVDVPIGLPSTGVRTTDLSIRSFVGPRRASVFLTPPRDVIAAPTYAEARRIAREHHGIGVTAQAYALRTKILEVDALVPDERRIREVHPEATFRMIAGRPLDHAKRTWNGQMERRRLLSTAGIEFPNRLGDAGRAPVDDILDAAACAWTAQRCARGEAVRFPEGPVQDERGVDMAVWV